MDLSRNIILEIDLNTGHISTTTNNYFYNTDRNIAYFYIKLYSTNAQGEKQYVGDTDSSQYKVYITAIKPKTTTPVKLLGERVTNSDIDDKIVYKITIPNELMKQQGFVYCEGQVIYNNQELTTDCFSFKVNPDKLTEYNLTLITDPDLPILQDLLAQVKQLKLDARGIDDSTVSDEKTWSSENINTKFKENTKLLNDIHINICNYPRLTNESDDTRRIQQALNENSKVYLPNGTYKVSKLVLNSNNFLYGESIKGVIIQGIDNNVDSVIYSDLTSHDYVIENMTIKPSTDVVGILLDNQGELSQQDVHPEIRNVVIVGGSKGLYVKSGVRGGKFDNVRPGDSREIGILMESTDSIFINCIVALAQYDGFKITNGNNTFINCKAFCCGSSNRYGAGFKLQGSFNKVLNCEFQQNTFENLYLQNANSNMVQGCILDGAGWQSKTLFPELKYSDNGTGNLIPISSLRSFNSKKNIIDVNIINGRLNSVCATAFYCQYASGDENNYIRYNTLNTITDNNDFVDYKIDYPNAYFINNKVEINTKEQYSQNSKLLQTPDIVSANAEIIKGGYIIRDGIVYVDIQVKSLKSYTWISELLSFPAPLLDSSLSIYFESERKFCKIDTNGKMVVGPTIVNNEVYTICGTYILK